jgi:hypothetical protein
MMAVTAIQPNIQISERKTDVGRRANMERLEELTRTAAAPHPALIVWPESAIPGDLHTDPLLLARVQSLSDTIGIPLIVGAAEVEKFATSDPEMTVAAARSFSYSCGLASAGSPGRRGCAFGLVFALPDLIPGPNGRPRVSE